MDILNFVNEFHSNTKLPKVIITYFVALIPKIDNPQGLYEYRPIFLIGSLYKILSKLLASKIKKVVNNLVSQSKSAFIAYKYIQDGVLVVNEVLDFAKIFKKECLMIKMDLQKAYDCISIFDLL